MIEMTGAGDIQPIGCESSHFPLDSKMHLFGYRGGESTHGGSC